MNESAGVTRTLGKALLFLGNNLEYVANVLGILITRFAVGMVIKKVGPLIVSLRATSAAFFALYGNIVRFAIADALLTVGNAASILGKALLAVPLKLFA